MHKSIIKRIQKIETKTFQPRWRVVVKDTDGSYNGECGKGLTQEQFDLWVKQQDTDTQVIIVEILENFASEKQETTFKVENHVDKNTIDLLKEYEEILERTNETNFSHVNLDEYSEEDKEKILAAYGIINEHHPAVSVEGIH